MNRKFEESCENCEYDVSPSPGCLIVADFLAESESAGIKREKKDFRCPLYHKAGENE